MDMFSFIKSQIKLVVKDLYDLDFNDFLVEYPQNEEFGDFASNIALSLSKELRRKPMDIANEISQGFIKRDIFSTVGDHKVLIFKNIYAAQPGFVNFVLTDNYLNIQLNILDIEKSNPYKNQKILFEYTDPNPFKVFHIGHLMSNSIGESLSRIYQYLGADLKRVNYQGDVGLHVAKSIWGLLSLFKDTNSSLDSLEKLPLLDRVYILGKGYALGAAAYEDSEQAQTEIKELNFLIYIAAQELLKEKEGWLPVVDYKKHLGKASTFDYNLVKEIYYKGREWSLENFELLYSQLGTKFDDYYFESKVGEYGLKVVEDHLTDGVFEKSEGGAVIFKGENVGLHTRVFINSYGLPTYEAKDLGLAPLKYETFKYDKSFIITANEVNEYFKVVLAAMSKINPDISSKTIHIGHGIMRFKSGKMSSRTGDVITGTSLIHETKEALLDIMKTSGSSLDDTLANKEFIANKLAIGAIKYSILKQSFGKDILFDRGSAIAITGDTGPYLLYTYARINSVLEKSGFETEDIPDVYTILNFSLEGKERSVLNHLSRFIPSVEEAAKTYSPSFITTYLFDLAQRFNAFYAQYSILDAETNDKKMLRLLLVLKTANTLRTGLNLLGIETVSKM